MSNKDKNWDDDIWAEALKNEFNDIPIKASKKGKHINAELDDMMDTAKMLRDANQYYFLKHFPRNISWEELTSEKQNLIYSIALKHKEYFEKEGRYLSQKHDAIILDEIEKLDAKKEKLLAKLSKQDFPSLELCSHQMVKRTNQGKHKNYRAGWRWAIKNCTIQNKPIKNLKQLSSAWDRICDSGKNIPITERMKRDLDKD